MKPLFLLVKRRGFWRGILLSVRKTWPVVRVNEDLKRLTFSWEVNHQILDSGDEESESSGIFFVIIGLELGAWGSVVIKTLRY